MKNYKLILFLLAIVILGIFIVVKKSNNTNQVGNRASIIESSSVVIQNQQTNTGQNNQIQQNSNSDFLPPLEKANERVTKKYFGIYVTPQNSPVSPERFSGFHTGADFETFAEEANSDVAVHVVCTGKLLEKRYASGYGGVAVQACTLNEQPITVVYGHLNLASITPSSGSNLNAGDFLGNLGKGYSSQTDGERKHLHLGFHKGTAINILGYVQSKSELSNWIDPCLYVCGK